MLYTDRRANTTPNTNRRQQGESAPPTNRSRSSAGTYLSRTKMSLFEETAGDGMGMTLDPRPTTGPTPRIIPFYTASPPNSYRAAHIPI